MATKQSVYDVLANFNVVGEQGLETKRFADGNFPLSDVVPPHVVDHLAAEFPAESPDVTQERRPEQAVTEQPCPLTSQVIQILRPSDVNN